MNSETPERESLLHYLDDRVIHHIELGPGIP